MAEKVKSIEITISRKNLFALLISLLLSFTILLMLERFESIACMPVFTSQVRIPGTEDPYYDLSYYTRPKSYDPCSTRAYTGAFKTAFGSYVPSDEYLVNLDMVSYTVCDCQGAAHKWKIYLKAVGKDWWMLVLGTGIFYAIWFLLWKYKVKIRMKL